MSIREAVGRFRRFHGRAPSKAARVLIPFPRSVVYLGQAVALEYRSDKLAPSLGDRPGCRRFRTYRHKIGAGVRVYCDPKGSTLYITGGHLRVTDWMRG